MTDDEDEKNPVKYLVTNKIDAPTMQLIRTYSMRWRIETFFRDSKQDLGFEDCEVERDAGANRHWHLLMLAYSCLRLGVADSALGTVLSQTTSLCNDLKHSLKKAVQNLLSWTLNNADQGIDGLMDELDGVLILVRSQKLIQYLRMFQLRRELFDQPGRKALNGRTPVEGVLN